MNGQRLDEGVTFTRSLKFEPKYRHIKNGMFYRLKKCKKKRTLHVTFTRISNDKWIPINIGRYCDGNINYKQKVVKTEKDVENVMKDLVSAVDWYHTRIARKGKPQQLLWGKIRED